jgi:hypothetical protein
MYNIVNISEGGTVLLTLCKFNSSVEWNYSIVSINTYSYNTNVYFRSCNVSNLIHSISSILMKCNYSIDETKAERKVWEKGRDIFEYIYIYSYYCFFSFFLLSSFFHFFQHHLWNQYYSDLLNLTVSGCVIENVSSYSWSNNNLDGSVIDYKGYREGSSFLINNCAFKNITDTDDGLILVEGVIAKGGLSIFLSMF